MKPAHATRLTFATVTSLLILAGTACTSGSPGGKAADSSSPLELTVGEAQSGGSVAIAAGGSLTLELPVTSGTGYAWEVRVEPATLLRVPAEPVTIRGNAAMPGSVTQVRWVLTGAKVGKGSVEAVYRRPWEQDVPPAKRFSVSVVVETAKVPASNP